MRQQWLPVAAVALGVFLGRAYKQGGPVGPAAGSPGLSAAAKLLSEPEGPANRDKSDSAVEAELARLLGGGMSPEAGTRTALQAMDAITVAFSEKSDLRRFLGIYEAASEIGKEDIGAALERARNEKNDIALRALERRWAEIDPLGAIKAWTEGNARPLGDAFFTAWAKSNPAGALRWYSSLEEGDFKTQSRGLILERVAKTDPQRALDYANQMPEGKDQNQILTTALTALGAKDPAEALAAAKRLPEGPSRKAGIDSVVGQIAASNLEEAQKLVAQLPPNTVSTAGSVIAAALLKQSPEQALAWATVLPEGQSKDSAYRGLAREWATVDVTAAATWLDTLPKGTSRDSAVASFANRTAPRDPEGATLWASTLPAGDQRSSTLSQTVGIWQLTNPAAAAEWVSSAPGLSADERAVLSQPQTQRPDFQRPPSQRRQRAGN